MRLSASAFAVASGSAPDDFRATIFARWNRSPDHAFEAEHIEREVPRLARRIRGMFSRRG